MGDEKYSGRKFRTEFSGREPPEDTRIYEIIRLGGKFHRMGLLPKEKGGHAGNMSFRNSRGFVITAGGIDKGKLIHKDFVQVLSCNIDTKVVKAEGETEPSSETLTHHLIYSKRKDVNAVIHVHDAKVLEHARSLNVPLTKKVHPYGTPELAYEIGKVLGKNSFIAVKGHGVIALGKSLWEAGKFVETYHQAAENL
jgi:ribulose-5-phosphate 4-epimerase/fuculose-1-phosphate aldolase